MDNLKTAWDRSYENRDNFVFYPHEEVIRFVARFIRKRIGIDEFRDVVPFASGVRVLDLGCGIGRHVIYLRELGVQSYGIDLSDSALRTAHTWAARRGIDDADKIFAQGDIRTLPWPDNHFDFAISHGVLDSMPFSIARAACIELSRVMAPEGLFYCDLISGDDSDHEPNYAGEETVMTAHELGTIQSYFNTARIDALIDGAFAIHERILIRRENQTKGGYGSRYHLVLRNIRTTSPTSDKDTP